MINMAVAVVPFKLTAQCIVKCIVKCIQNARRPQKVRRPTELQVRCAARLYMRSEYAQKLICHTKTRIFSNDGDWQWPLGLLLLLTSLTSHAQDQYTQDQIRDSANLPQNLIQCRSEPAALLRLACYDNLFQQPINSAIAAATVSRSDTAQKGLTLEKQRIDDSVEFLISQAEGELSAEVIISTPALGAIPPRPVLIFSCQDNITRMQIAFFQPLSADKTSTIKLKTSSGKSFTSHWFIRDNGLLLESSRGLPGIAEIQQLFNAETLSIESDNQALNGLSFQINGLAKVIAPLRQACRW